MGSKEYHLDKRRISSEIDMVTLIKVNGEEYRFTYDIKGRAEILRTLGRFASNPDLSFTWYDAAIVSGEIRLEGQTFDSRKNRFNFV